MPRRQAWRDGYEAVDRRLMTALGKRLHAAREALGLSREQVCLAVGQLSMERLEDFELGVAVPHLMLLDRICAAIGLDFTEEWRAAKAIASAPGAVLALNTKIDASSFLAWVDAERAAAGGTTLDVARHLASLSGGTATNWAKHIATARSHGWVTVRIAERFAGTVGIAFADIWSDAPPGQHPPKAVRRSRPSTPEQSAARIAKALGASPTSLAAKARHRPA